MSKFDKETKGEPFFEQRDKELEGLIDPSTGRIFKKLVKKVSCPLCDSDKYSELFIKNGFSFVRCSVCSHVYVNPQIVEEKTIGHYNDNSLTSRLTIDFISSKKQMEVRGELYEYFFSKIKNKIPTGKILDIGCSVGQFLDMGQKRGYDVLGLELNEQAISYAKKNYDVKIEKKLLHECNFPSNSFDIISMFGVIEHLTNPKDVVKDIYRLLKPGGVFIGICPNVQSLVCMVMHEQSRTFTGRLHLSYFSKKTINFLFNSVGFDKQKIEVNTKYTGKESLINYFQFLDPFGDEENRYLTNEFKKFITNKDNENMLEDKMNELGIGLKLVFMAKK